MTNKDFFFLSWTNEAGTLRRVIEALPEATLDYRPHERSRSAREIAWTIACEAHNIADVLSSGSLDEKGLPAPATKADILAHFDAAVKEIAARAPSSSEERWNATGEFRVLGQKVGEMPSSALAWLMHNDMIHHRGQLSTYIRPMGGKVPSIYGPSGDEGQPAAVETL